MGLEVIEEDKQEDTPQGTNTKLSALNLEKISLSKTKTLIPTSSSMMHHSRNDDMQS